MDYNDAAMATHGSAPSVTCKKSIGYGAVDSGDELYRELWHACAGPLATVPRQGDLVFYFLQGHIEQVFFCFFGILFMCFIFLYFGLNFWTISG